MLKAEAQVSNDREVCIRTYSSEAMEAKRYVTIDELSEFYTVACKFDIMTRLNFDGMQFKV